MKKTLYSLYHLEINSILRKSNDVYLIQAKEGKYILKYVSKTDENLYERLSFYHNETFLLPLKSIRNKYVEYFNEHYFIILPYLEEDFSLSYDIKLSFYIKSIAHLHNQSLYPLRKGDLYLENIISYFQKEISLKENLLLERMEIVEKEDYHSTSDWFFIMNYQHFLYALKEANKHTDLLEEEFHKESNLNLVLTYQNFQIEHIFLHEQKIISLEKMAIAPCVYDLYDVFINLPSISLSFNPYFKEYLNLHPLKPYEEEWLFALLFLLPLERKEDDLKDLSSLLATLKYLTRVEELAKDFYNPSKNK